MTPNFPPKPDQETFNDRLWTVRQVSEWLSVTELALRTMLKRGQLPAEAILRLGRRIRFRSDRIRHWALEQRIA